MRTIEEIEQAEVKTAAQWIEEIQDDIKEDGYSVTDDQIAMLIAARHLANAQIGNRRNIDRKQITGQELANMAGRLMEDQTFDSFIEQFRNEYESNIIQDGHAGKLEKRLIEYVRDHDDGSLEDDFYEKYYLPSRDEAKNRADRVAEEENNPSATGAQWIERMQRKAKSYGKIDVDDVYRLLAIRQLTNAVRKDGNNLKTTVLTEEQITQRVDALRKSSAISAAATSLLESPDREQQEDYNDIILQEMLSGHGGALEDRFEKELGKTASRLSNDDGAFIGRYSLKQKTPETYKNYAEWIYANKYEYNPTVRKVELKSLDNLMFEEKKEVSPLQHAALMAAACALSLNPSNKNEFDPKTLLKKANEYYKDPCFRFVMRDRKIMDEVNAGNVEEFSMRLQEACNDFGEVNINSETTQELISRIQGPEKNREEYLNSRGPKYKKMAETAAKLMSGDEVTDIDVLKTVEAIINYQTGKEKGFLSSAKNERFNDSMKLLAELTYGTDAEKYYRKQLDKVNEARGLKEGDRGYLTPESFISEETLEKHNQDMERNERLEEKREEGIYTFD